jgi:hypothetical protein
MNLSIYAIKVGTTSLDKLNINKELDIDVTPIVKDNPEYVDEDILEVSDELKNKNLDVYDVLLAGIEIND